MNVVASSGWLEYFSDAPNAAFFARPIEKVAELIVPSVSVLEVFKRILRQRNERDALQAAALMEQGKVVPLDSALALQAAKLGVQLRLPLADSVILATARDHSAIVWTQEADFEGIEGVEYRPKNTGSRRG